MIDEWVCLILYCPKDRLISIWKDRILSTKWSSIFSSILWNILKYKVLIPFKGCSLTLYQHLLPGVDDNGPLGTGIFHTFTSGNSENENLAALGLANNVSSYTCTCKWPIELFYIYSNVISHVTKRTQPHVTTWH